MLLQSLTKIDFWNTFMRDKKRNPPPPKEFVLCVVQTNTLSDLQEQHYPPTAQNWRSAWFSSLNTKYIICECFCANDGSVPWAHWAGPKGLEAYIPHLSSPSKHHRTERSFFFLFFDIGIEPPLFNLHGCSMLVTLPFKCFSCKTDPTYIFEQHHHIRIRSQP